MCLTLSPMVSLMYKAKCIHPRVNNSPIWGPKFMVVCYSVVWYCMLGHGIVWVLFIDGCSLQMGAKWEGTIEASNELSILTGNLRCRLSSAIMRANVKWLLERLVGRFPQICTVCYSVTFEIQKISPWH